MVIKVNKFGTILNGRPAGREAALVLKQLTKGIPPYEEIVFDFIGVVILTPSYADEFFHGLLQNNQRTIRTVNISSPVIADTLKIVNFPTHH